LNLQNVSKHWDPASDKFGNSKTTADEPNRDDLFPAFEYCKPLCGVDRNAAPIEGKADCRKNRK
jgi:hypothetical protein